MHPSKYSNKLAWKSLDLYNENGYVNILLITVYFSMGYVY